ncbi:MAG: hypothetical protein KBG28_10245 [Kofleriaceae bacterium]|jgi:spermidine synthase|nr:hypothetical protein [Kofleriaceae bacterium]MBP6841563.1 hypothetical protein [Kofleriaceae bacterium]MBP9204334.1 hypothetical protein [Kofleriaceae bacterium]
MIPWQVLGRERSPRGGELVLARRGAEYVIRVDGIELMTSRNTVSERALARLACAELAGRPRPNVLIGGLGMGFTAGEALTHLGRDANVEVAELLPVIVRWNREHLGALAGTPLADRRLRLIEGDVGALIARSPGRYDAILLDVDNGPEALTAPGNASLYTADGLQRLRAALRPDGVLAVWSAFEAPGFGRRLVAAGFRERRERIDAHGAHHLVWIATRLPERAPRPEAPRRAGPPRPPSPGSRRRGGR